MTKGNPLSAFVHVRRAELPLALNMFSYFFLVITTFWILKPLKKSLFIEYHSALEGFVFLGSTLTGAQAEMLAKVLNMGVAVVAVAAFSSLSRRFRRERLTFALTAVFMFAFALYAILLRRFGVVTVWSFYLFGDLFSTVMVAGFFAFLNDSLTSEEAHRLYGLIGLGGVTGGVFGSTVVRLFIEQYSLSTWMWVCNGISLVILVNAALAGRWIARHSRKWSPSSAASPALRVAPMARQKQWSPAIEGARLTLRSRYLLSIVAIVGLYEVVSQLMDFQFTATIEHYLTGDAIGRQFSTVYMITNWVSMLVQFFLTSLVLTRSGIVVALMILPSAMLSGSAAFMLLPILWVGSMLNTVDNGFAYSINQSAKEALYVPVGPEAKYEAKAFIDIFVQRFGKTVAIVLSLLLTQLFTDFSTVRWLSLLTIGVAVVWMRLVWRHAGDAPPRAEQADTAAS
jgi:ATP:ADP antiporter, AAA family